MPSLESVLAGIPGLAGYESARQNNQQRDLGQLQQAGLLQGILAKVREQQLAEQFRGALSSAKTPAELEAAAVQFGGPTAVLGHLDRQVSAANTKEMALARLAQAATQADRVFEIKLQGAKTVQERDALARERAVFRSNVERERLKYDTGSSVPAFTLPPLGGDSGVAPAPAAPSGGAVLAPQFEAGQGLQTSAPNLGSAFAQFAGGGGTPRTVSIDQPAASDLMLRGNPGAPGALGTAPLTPPDTTPLGANPLPPMPPEVARMPKKYQDQWVASQAKASIAGGGIPSKDTAVFVARQYLNGNDQAISGYARSVPAKLVLMDAIRSEAEKQGLSPEAVNARIAEFQGTKAASRSIGTRSAGIAMAAEEAQQAIQIVKDTSDNFQRTNFVPWNYALKAYDSNTGRPEVVEFGAAINALVNTYARALSPTGVPHQADKDHAREVLSTIQSPAQVSGVLGIINRELEIAKRAPQAVRDQIRKDVIGNRGGGKPSADQFFR